LRFVGDLGLAPPDRVLLEDVVSGRGVPFPPELVLAAFPYDAPLVGALALGIDATGKSQATAKLVIDNGGART